MYHTENAEKGSRYRWQNEEPRNKDFHLHQRSNIRFSANQNQYVIDPNISRNPNQLSLAPRVLEWIRNHLHISAQSSWDYESEKINKDVKVKKIYERVSIHVRNEQASRRWWRRRRPTEQKERVINIASNKKPLFAFTTSPANPYNKVKKEDGSRSRSLFNRVESGEIRINIQLHRRTYKNNLCRTYLPTCTLHNDGKRRVKLSKKKNSK